MLELPLMTLNKHTRNKTQPTNTLTMTTGVCSDLMEMIGKEVVEIQQTAESKSNFRNVVGELNRIIRRSDDYAENGTEGDMDEDYVWDGTRVGNNEWEYAFWSYLD